MAQISRILRGAIGSLVCVLALAACDREAGRLFDADPTSANRAAGFVEGFDALKLGHQLSRVGEDEAALEAYYQAAVQHGFTPEILTAIGNASLRLGRVNQAERVLRQSLDQNDQLPSTWNALGIALHTKGQMGEAREAFRVAYALDSGASPEIQANLQKLDEDLDQPLAEAPEETEFKLVRHGNGKYLLVENPQ
ncbi:MAG: tetratricopeptide repeat protein [Pseudomonadota bacterium]